MRCIDAKEEKVGHRHNSPSTLLNSEETFLAMKMHATDKKGDENFSDENSILVSSLEINFFIQHSAAAAVCERSRWSFHHFMEIHPDIWTNGASRRLAVIACVAAAMEGMR